MTLLPPCVYSKTKNRKTENDVSSLYTYCGLTDVQNMRDRQSGHTYKIYFVN